MSGRDWEVAEIGRLLHAHRLDPALACAALRIDAKQARRLVSIGDVVSGRSSDMAERAALLLNILLRLELRCAHDTRAIATALERPIAEIGGTSIGAALRAPIDLAGLRQLRCVAGTMPVPKVKIGGSPTLTRKGKAMFTNDKRAAAEARALTIALAIAAKVGWRFDRGPLPTTSFAQFLYVDAPQLLLVPTSAALPFAMRQVDPVVREARSDALIVSSAGEGSPSFAMATWARRQTAWTHSLALWLAEGGEAWLVPAAVDSDSLGFRLINRLHHVTAVPWVFASERQAGLDRAAAWMRSVVEG